MGMKFATEISNIQRVGVILYMEMKSSINHQWVHSRRSYPLYGNEIRLQWVYKSNCMGVIPYMGMKLKIHYFLLSFFKVIPYMGMKFLSWHFQHLLQKSYHLYGNEIKGLLIVSWNRMSYPLYGNEIFPDLAEIPVIIKLSII